MPWLCGLDEFAEPRSINGVKSLHFRHAKPAQGETLRFRLVQSAYTLGASCCHVAGSGKGADNKSKADRMPAP